MVMIKMSIQLFKLFVTFQRLGLDIQLGDWYVGVHAFLQMQSAFKFAIDL